LKQKKLAQWIVENGGYISYSAQVRAAEFYSRADYGLLGYWPGVDFIDHISTIHLSAPVSDISALSQANAVFQLLYLSSPALTCPPSVTFIASNIYGS